METNQTRITFLGGLNDDNIGLNCTLFESGYSRVMVDMGTMMANERVSEYIQYALDGLDDIFAENPPALFLTHAHEDHIGDIAHAINRGIRIPVVYGPKTANRLARKKLEKLKVPVEAWPKFVNMAARERIQIGDITVEAIKAAHSCPGFMYCLETPGGRFLLTGDFKDDPTCQIHQTDYDHTSEIAAREGGIAAVLGDSTRSDTPYELPTEQEIQDSYVQICRQYPNQRVIVPVMSQNEERLLRLMAAATLSGREIVVCGGGLEESLEIFEDVHKLSERVEALVGKKPVLHKATAETFRNEAPDSENAVLKTGQTLVLATGTQAEVHAAMKKASKGRHPILRLSKNDVVAFSSSVIPNAPIVRAVREMLRDIRKHGCTIIEPSQKLPLHASGHATQPCLKRLYESLKAGLQLVIPVHGDNRLLSAHADFLNSLGLPFHSIKKNGMELTFTKDPAGYSYISGQNIRTVSVLGIKEEADPNGKPGLKFYRYIRLAVNKAVQALVKPEYAANKDVVSLRKAQKVFWEKAQGQYEGSSHQIEEDLNKISQRAEKEKVRLDSKKARKNARNKGRHFRP